MAELFKHNHCRVEKSRLVAKQRNDEKRREHNTDMRYVSEGRSEYIEGRHVRSRLALRAGFYTLTDANHRQCAQFRIYIQVRRSRLNDWQFDAEHPLSEFHCSLGVPQLLEYFHKSRIRRVRAAFLWYAQFHEIYSMRKCVDTWRRYLFTKSNLDTLVGTKELWRVQVDILIMETFIRLHTSRKEASICMELG